MIFPAYDSSSISLYTLEKVSEGDVSQFFLHILTVERAARQGKILPGSDNAQGGKTALGKAAAQRQRRIGLRPKYLHPATAHRSV